MRILFVNNLRGYYGGVEQVFEGTAPGAGSMRARVHCGVFPPYTAEYFVKDV